MRDRLIGVFKLDVATFESIEHDEGATGQAALVVLIVAILGGIGSAIGTSYMNDSTTFGPFFSSVISVFAGWVIWSFLTYFIGTKFFGGEADMGEMLRVIGFAYAPQMLGIIPCFGALVGAIWSLAAAFIGIRQGLDLSNGKTFLTIIVGFVVYLLIGLAVGMLFAVGGAATSPFDFTA